LCGRRRYDLLVAAAPSVEDTAASAEAFLAHARAAVVATALPFARPRHLHLLDLVPGDLTPGQAAKVLLNAAEDDSAAAAEDDSAAPAPELLAALAAVAGCASAEPPPAPQGKAAEVLAPGLFVVTHGEHAVTAVSAGVVPLSGLEKPNALPVFVETSIFHTGKDGCNGDGFCHS